MGEIWWLRVWFWATLSAFAVVSLWEASMRHRWMWAVIAAAVAWPSTFQLWKLDQEKRSRG